MKESIVKLSLAVPMLIGINSMTGIAAEKDQKQNVLFIIVDDLRTQLGCYGNTTVKTPNIDKLASEGFTFLNNHCNYPVCGPSRASIFSGLRPNNKLFTSNEARVDQEVPDIIPMNMFFKNNGYSTVSLGKVYHNKQDSKAGWTVNPWGAGDNDPKKDITGWRDYVTAENQELCKSSAKKAGYAYEIADVDDDAYYDGKTATKAIGYLRDFKKNNHAFFMTIGFVKPHLPFNAPKKYYDLYPEDQVKLPENYFFPENAPEVARHLWPELRVYKDIPAKSALSDDMAKKLIRGYNACASYSDAMVGRVMDELKALNLDKNTVIVLIGDHGWHLGEHTLWCKHSNFEKVLRTILIVKTPQLAGGKQIAAGTELVDVYPTLCELSGQPTPGHLDGTSLLPLMQNPVSKWKEAVYSIFENAWSVKTERYLYTEWIDEAGKTTARMLYDHQKDPEENKNIAEDPASKNIVARHSALLRIYYNKSNGQ